MKKILSLLFFLAFYNISYAQSLSSSQLEESQRFLNNQSFIYKTLVISTTSYPQNTFREFKKELQSWSTKITSTQIDTIQHTFTLTHNALLDGQELQEFLSKYHIKNSSIISYQ
jgi:hypothetical protein